MVSGFADGLDGDGEGGGGCPGSEAGSEGADSPAGLRREPGEGGEGEGEVAAWRGCVAREVAQPVNRLVTQIL